MHRERLQQTETSPPFAGPAARAAGRQPAKPAASPPGCLALPWLAAERRGQRVVTGWGVPGDGAVMGPGLLGEPAEAQGLTGGAAGW